MRTVRILAWRICGGYLDPGDVRRFPTCTANELLRRGLAVPYGRVPA